MYTTQRMDLITSPHVDRPNSSRSNGHSAFCCADSTEAERDSSFIPFLSLFIKCRNRSTFDLHAGSTQFGSASDLEFIDGAILINSYIIHSTVLPTERTVMMPQSSRFSPQKGMLTRQ